MDYLLILNCGSSSIKFSVFLQDNLKRVYTGLVDNINQENCHMSFEQDKMPLSHGDYARAFKAIEDKLRQYKILSHIKSVGHRVVHGGNQFTRPVIVNNVVMKALTEIIPLAPLHNPANLQGITFAQTMLPEATQVAVFDTAFHQTITPVVYTYAIDYALSHKYHIRQYGFHGISHQYVSMKAAQVLGKSSGNFISTHLGNGCSITAIINGKSIDTSMGFTPLDGLVMGTRCGDIDPGVIGFLKDLLNYDIDKIMTLLNKESGLLGLCGASDMREIEKKVDQGYDKAQLALDIFCHRIAKYISAYLLYFQNLDGLIFTGGIGENSARVRQNAIQRLSNIGFLLDEQKNQTPCKQSHEIQAANSHRIMVIPTDEELMIAQQTRQLTL
ncbi:acetate/propionate family kinase [Facilibium subflavum]|uniref:acetate/propionate family kinase n=1 Tax=Facilibium subflavum TaxID=2219058 RepID=UPI000E64F42E|nr:acetate kinase [Facilibium subflavum]